MTIALDANFRDECEDNKLRCENVDQCQARQSECTWNNRHRNRVFHAFKGRSTLLDLWHWDITNLFGQHVVGCDSRGSTNAGFRKVSLVFKSPTYTSAEKKNQTTSATLEKTGTGKFAPGNVRWQMEDTHNAHRGQRDNMTCNVMTRENVHISLWSPFSMASWFFD